MKTNSVSRRYRQSILNKTREPILIFPEEVLAMLCISKRTLQYWRKMQVLPSYQLGRTVVFDKWEILTFMKYKEQQRRRMRASKK